MSLCQNQLKSSFLECAEFSPFIPNHCCHTCASDLPLSQTVTTKTQLSPTHPSLFSPHTVSWSPLFTNIAIHKACYSLYFIDSQADIKADGFSLNPLKTSDAEWLCSIFLKKHFNTAAFMSECLPTVTDIESVDCCMTGSQTLSNETDEVFLHSPYLVLSDNPNI